MIAAGFLSLSLGLDTLAVAVGLGLSELPRAKWLRVGLAFAFFEGALPIGGLVVGNHLSHAVGQWAISPKPCKPQTGRPIPPYDGVFHSMMECFTRATQFAPH